MTKTTKKSKHDKKIGRDFFTFHCKNCHGCIKRKACTNSKYGRSLNVSIHKTIIDNFVKEMRIESKKKMIEKRKEIVEHPFGTIKMNFGFNYFMQIGLDKTKAEFSFICFIYNFKRVLNILGIKEFMNALN